LHVHGNGVKNDACGCSFAVLSAQVSTVSTGLRLRYTFRRGRQADARGDTHLLDHAVQAVARGAARCLLHVLGRSAKTDACGRSFAVLSTQVSTAGLRLRHSRLK
jgi:hypothetical protein